MFWFYFTPLIQLSSVFYNWFLRLFYFLLCVWALGLVDLKLDLIFVPDKGLLKITEDEFSGPPFNVILLTLQPRVLISCNVSNVFWENAGGDWALCWTAALFLGCAHCAWEVSIHTPSLWGEQVTKSNAKMDVTVTRWMWSDETDSEIASLISMFLFG